MPDVRRILLFDVDLTLIRSSDAGRLAMDRAIARVLDVERGTDGIGFDGRTDRAIFMEAVGKIASATALDVDKAMAAYVEELPRALAEQPATVMPGVWELLESLQPRAAAGVATGNMRHGAQAKLASVGLWECFRGGGFGDTATERHEIVRAALADVARHHGLAADAATAVVIGDTPLDVAAARAVGLRTLGVGTGQFSADELRAAGAEMAVADLRDTARVVGLLLGEQAG